MRVLLVCEETDVRSKLLFSLESFFKANVIEVNGIDLALYRFRERLDAGFDFILWNMPSARPSDLQRFFTATTECPSIVVIQGDGSELKDRHGWNVFGTVRRSVLLTELPQVVTIFMQKNQIAPSGESKRDFSRIRTHLLLSIAPLKGDLYIKLSDSKYVKIFREGDRFDRSDLEKYTVKKGIEYLYIRDHQAEEFLEKYRIELEKASVSKVVNLDDAVRSAATAHETIQELGMQLGFNRNVQSLVKHQMEISLKVMGRSPRLSDIMDRLEAFKGRYIASHSTFTGYLACAIASQVEWGSETTFHKLNLAAFLHDITLTNHALAECDTIAHVENGPYTDEEKRAYKVHPLRAAEIAKTLKECPPDVDQIILAHHERPDATGFPRGLSAGYISPLTAIFIVAHELAKESLRSVVKFSPQDFLMGANMKYTSSQFRKVLAAVERL